ncbi:MAG: DUF2156 domain-containing protein [Peptococcaceae bacterium]|jgi:hypothetical protein|nr:DUF2156 domain-containing protein [Peptococcaceae bacterium]
MEQFNKTASSTIHILSQKDEKKLKHSDEPQTFSYLNFRPVEISHRPLINSYLQDHHYNTIEYLFTTLFIWQESYGFAWAEEEDVLYIRSCYHNQTKFFPPILKTSAIPLEKQPLAYAAAIEKILVYCKENSIEPIFEEITEQDRDNMLHYLKQDFHFQANRDLANYIYYVSTLTHLKGRSFNGKRNHIRHFEAENPGYQFQPITEALLPACRLHAEGWYEHHPEKDQSTLIEEKEAILKALDYFTELELTGGCIIIDGKVEGFAIGEPLNPDMAVIHFEKGNLNINGIYTALNKYFLAQSWQDYLLVNRAEDLGLPGLKKAKKDYKPAWLEMKYTATRIQ